MSAGRSCDHYSKKLAPRSVTHAVGPKWNNGSSNEEELLSKAYRISLRPAQLYGIQSIAFSNRNTGIYNSPPIKAAEIAIETALNHLDEFRLKIKVLFVCNEIIGLLYLY